MSEEQSVVKTFASIDDVVALLGSAIDLNSSDVVNEAVIKCLLDRRLLWLETANFSFNGKGIGIVGTSDDFYPGSVSDNKRLLQELSRGGLEYFSSYCPAYQDSSNGLYLFSQGKRPIKLSTLVCLDGDKNDVQSIADSILHPAMGDLPQARKLILKALPMVEIVSYAPQQGKSLAFHYRAIKSLLGQHGY